MPLVYITNRGPHDYSEAKQFGELIYCTDGSLNKFDTAQMYRELNDAMHDSCEDDYILITSLASVCCIACAIFAAKHQCLNLLIHKGDSYIVRQLYFKDQTSGNY